MPRDTKTGEPRPLFDYQKNLYEAYAEVDENGVPVPLWIKKATGIAGTEFALRYFVWECVKDDKLKGSLIAIVTGPNIELATEAITRVKNLFQDFFPEHAKFDTKQTFCFINGVKIQAFPSHNLSALRGRPNLKRGLGDEGDHFPKNQQWELRDVLERYIGKSGCKVVLNGTPNAPGGLFEKIEFEEPCLYKKMFLHYSIGVNKIYSPEFLEKAKDSPSFPREYELKYLGLEGNVVTDVHIDRACNMAPPIWEKINQNPKLYFGPDYWSSIGTDPSPGTSPFGIVVTKYIDKKIVVVHAKEYDRPDHTKMIDETLFLMNKYKTLAPKNYVDAANPGWIRQLKKDLKEYADYHYYTDQKMKRLIFSAKGMIACPIAFGQYGTKMLEHMRILFEKGKIVIDRKQFPELVTSLRTAKISEETGKLDKERTSYNHMFDGLRLNLLNYRTTQAVLF